MITIICSNLNSIKWIKGYLECVNNLYLQEFHIHFIDAGSQDGSWKKIKDYKFREGIISHYTVNKNCSIYEAWNIGYKNSTTEYCMNLNTDDRLFPNALNILSKYTEIHTEIDVFYSPCLITNHYDHHHYNGIYDWVHFSKYELLKNCICGPFPMVRTKSILEVGLFNTNFNISGDYEMWLRLESKNKKFMKIKEPIGGYYLNPKGKSTNKQTFKNHLNEDATIRSMYNNKLNNKNNYIPNSIKSFLKRIFYGM